MNKSIQRLLLLALSLVVLSGCANTSAPKKEEGFFGTYKLNQIAYLSELSSASKEHLQKLLEKATYVIKEDAFSITLNEKTLELQNPKYEKEDINLQGLEQMMKELPDFESEITEQYRVYSGEDPSDYRIFVGEEAIYLATFTFDAVNEKVQYIEVDQLQR